MWALKGRIIRKNCIIIVISIVIMWALVWALKGHYW